jgi:type IV pilus assembly protein PilY1
MMMAGLAVLILSAAFGADFVPQTSVFSAPKNPPAGFSQIVEPNVLLLIDTSGSMVFYLDKDNPRPGGDGSKPLTSGRDTFYYFGRDLNPGNNMDDNNDASESSFNYHKELRYIPNDLLPSNPNLQDFFSYDLNQHSGEWEKSSEFSLPFNYRYHQPDLRLQIRPFFSFSYRDVRQNETPPSVSAFDYYRWIWDGAWYLQKYSGVSERKYKYPNDSRLYNLKNVVHRLVDNPDLVGGLRIGLAGYHQNETNNTNDANYYKWLPNSSNTQRISWTSSGNQRAVLHVPFGSTNSEDHLIELKKLVDGEEKDGNKELRAHGGTPLADSIFNNSGNSAYHYLNNAIQYWCQDNWLVVLTDGQDDAFPSNPGKAPDAVKALYDANLSIAGARPVKTMVIGMIDPNNSNQLPLAESIAKMADYGDDGKLQAGAYTNGVWNLPINESKAFFATDVQKLMLAFETIFKTIQDVAATGSAPLVNPPKTAGGTGKLYSTGFKPSSTRQWTGFLSSYSITGDTITPEWEAGQLVSSRPNAGIDRRIIGTADWGSDGVASKFPDTGYSETNFKEFSSSNASALKPFVAGNFVISDTELGKFINWVRGEDVWGETEGGKRWKLGDPYHVGLVEVGSPQSLLTDPAYRSFAEDSTNKARTRIVYMHANDGMVHAFNSDTGKEEWAFIPPNVLNYPRLMGTKLVSDGTWIFDDKKSIPRYLLDGPLIAEDILLNGNYRTVLLGGLGRAGAGLYALDITIPGKPSFLWSLENNVYDSQGILRTENRTFLKWTGGDGTASSSFSTAVSSSSTVPGRLRLTVSTPFIGTVDLETLSGLETKWVALLGAGAKNFPALEVDEGGKAVIILDMKDGSLEKEIIHNDLGSVVAPLSVEAGPRPMRIRKFYFGDDQGAIFEGDLSSYDKSEWGLGKVFSPGESVPEGGLFTIPYSVEVGMIKNRKWLFWGTGDPDWLFGEREGQCYVFGMNRSLAGSTSFTMGDLPELMNISGDQYDDSVAVSANGWRLPLGEGEMVSTPVVLYRGHIFFATYIPKTDDPCAVGDSKFYIMKADTGLGGFVTYAGDEITSWKKSVKLQATKISGITVTDGKVYVGITAFSNASDPNTALGAFTGNISVNGNLLVFDVPKNVMSDDSGGSSTKTEPAYWRDWKP